MADQDAPEDRPSLEMPSFSLRRRKRADRSVDEGTAASLPTESLPAASLATPPDRASAPAPPVVDPPEPAERPEPPGPAAPAERPEPRRVTRPVRTTQLPAVVPAHQHDDDAVAARPPREGIPGLVATAGTGVVVGALAVLLVWLASLGCEAVRGTASCGGGPGFVVLVAILVLLAYAGAALLRAVRVPDAGSTSVLAVGVTAVLVLVLFTDALFEWWVSLVVPVVSALAHALSWWVTAQVAQPDADRPRSR